MTPEQYKEKLIVIEAEYAGAKKQLAIRYAKESNNVSIGDTITDHIGKLIVESIGYYLGHGLPECIYHGKILTSKGEPIKRGTHRDAYQSNLLTPSSH